MNLVYIYYVVKVMCFAVIRKLIVLVSQKSMKYLVHNCVQSLTHATITIQAMN